jgi:hypothetical protein
MLPRATTTKIPGEMMYIETDGAAHHNTERAQKEHGKRPQRETAREMSQQQERKQTTDGRQTHTAWADELEPHSDGDLPPATRIPSSPKRKKKLKTGRDTSLSPGRSRSSSRNTGKYLA